MRNYIWFVLISAAFSLHVHAEEGSLREEKEVRITGIVVTKELTKYGVGVHGFQFPVCGSKQGYGGLAHMGSILTSHYANQITLEKLLIDTDKGCIAGLENMRVKSISVSCSKGTFSGPATCGPKQKPVAKCTADGAPTIACEAKD